MRYRRNEWYLAHVVKKTDDMFDVYFPEDYKKKKSVPLINIRPVRDECTEPTRGELLGKVFTYPGDKDVPSGPWKVRRIGSECNKYFCTSMEPNAKINADDFEIGYVIKCYKKDLQRKYENPFL